MRNLWHRLLVKLGLRRDARVYHAGKAKLSIRRPDGTWVDIGIITNVSYNIDPIFPMFKLDPGDKTYIAGKTKFQPVEVKRERTDEAKRLFRERHCRDCITCPDCKADRNEYHREGCAHVCTHDYQRFAP